MEIGKPQREFESEPYEDPFRKAEPTPSEPVKTPEPTPVKTPEKVPVGR